MRRREFLFGMACAAVAGCTTPIRSAREPQLWMTRRSGARVYLLGAAEATDGSWLTPRIERAFKSSIELWLETPPPTWSPSLVKELAYDRDRTFFEALEPAVRVRAEAYVDELRIDRTTIEPMKPWFAYYRINGAFWAQHPRAATMQNPDQVFSRMANDQGKPIRYEFASGDELLRFFASMSPKVQSQYIEMLLDFLDDERRGMNDRYFQWVYGEPSAHALDRMREKTPELYRVLQKDRNVWWAKHIEGLLNAGGTRFVLLGMNHMLGADGVPEELARIGIRASRA